MPLLAHARQLATKTQVSGPQETGLLCQQPGGYQIRAVSSR
jgi:hypothetical protein